MVKKDGQRNHLLTVIYIAALALAVALVLSLGKTEKSELPKIGYITTFAATPDVAGFKGVTDACAELGMELLVRDNVPEFDGSCPKAVAELVKEGASMIILSSPGYSQEMVGHYDSYPAITFYGIYASYASFDVDNLTSYSTRIYQARYLSGIVAGACSRSGRIGFVATEQTVEVCRNINAFTLGVRSVDPDAEVLVVWTGPEALGREKTEQAAKALIEREGVDVITYHHNHHTVVDVAEAAGVASIGYYTVAEGVSDNYLTCAACDYAILYEQIIREYLKGQSSSTVSDWLGLESGVVGLTEFSPRVTEETRERVRQAQERILSGLDVFINEIRDNQGVVRCGAGESMPDEALLRYMDWLAEGVRVCDAT